MKHTYFNCCHALTIHNKRGNHWVASLIHLPFSSIHAWFLFGAVYSLFSFIPFTFDKFWFFTWYSSLTKKATLFCVTLADWLLWQCIHNVNYQLYQLEKAINSLHRFVSYLPTLEHKILESNLQDALCGALRLRYHRAKLLDSILIFLNANVRKKSAKCKMIVQYITPYHTPPLPLQLINHTPKNVAYPKFRHVTTSEAGKACRDKFRVLSYIVTLYFFMLKVVLSLINQKLAIIVQF